MLAPSGNEVAVGQLVHADERIGMIVAERVRHFIQPDLIGIAADRAGVRCKVVRAFQRTMRTRVGPAMCRRTTPDDMSRRLWRQGR